MAEHQINMEGLSENVKASLPKHHNSALETTVSGTNIYVKMRFIRKVFGILSVQLIFSTFITSVMLFTPITRFYINENSWLVTVAFLLCVVLLLSLMIKRRESPMNCVLLVVFTFVEAFSAAVIVAYYDQLAILQALILTTFVVVTLFMCTFQAKCDFNTWNAGLMSCFLILLAVGFIQMFLGSTYLEVLLSIFGALAFTIFLAYDIQNIMGRLFPEEYVVGVIDLYIDMINIFPYIAKLIGRPHKNML